jgi:UDPglucose 6-dehydrogenase
VLSVVDDPVLAVLGLAYKEGTDSVKNSPSLALLQHLHEFHVRLFDPVVPAAVAAHPRAVAASSASDAARGADALLVMTPWPEFHALDLSGLAAAMRGRILIDPHGVLDETAARRAGFAHFRIGVHA